MNQRNLRQQINRQTGYTGFLLARALFEIETEQGELQDSRFVYVDETRINQEYEQMVQPIVDVNIGGSQLIRNGMTTASNYNSGSITSSGRRFNWREATCALNMALRIRGENGNPRRMPFGSLVLVTNMDEGSSTYLQSMVAEYTDNGPFHVGLWNNRRQLAPHPTRGIDVSTGFKRMLGLDDLARVHLEIIRPEGRRTLQR